MFSKIKLRYWQLVLYLSFIPAVIYVYQVNTTLLWISLVVYMFQQFLGFCIGLHRYISHRSFKTSRFWDRVIVYTGVLCTVGSPIEWTLVHRCHHKYVDTEDDPHSPHVMGVPKASFCLHFIEGKKTRVRVSDVSKVPFYAWVSENYFRILTIYSLSLLFFGLEYLAAIYVIPATMNIFATYVGLGIVTHKWGYQNYYCDTSRNSLLINILTVGDGWHNNHHRFPGRWDFKINWWEIDPPSWLIKRIKHDLDLGEVKK